MTAISEVEKRPAICDVLGVEVEERFHIRFSANDISHFYWIDENGDLINALGNRCNELVISLINKSCELVTLPKHTEQSNEVINAVRLLKEFCYNQKCSECSLKTPLDTCEVRNLGKYIPYGVVEYERNII